MGDKKELSIKEALEACFILFQKNIESEALLQFKNVVAPSCEEELFSKEWQAFVLATIYYGFAKSAPAYMVLEFVRSVKYMLKTIQYSDEAILDFLDNQFQVYIGLAIEDTLQQYPAIFFERIEQKKLDQVDKKCVAVLSSAMAMLTATSVDTFEKYDYKIE